MQVPCVCSRIHLAWKLRKTSACIVQFANNANTSWTVIDQVFFSGLVSVFDNWVFETSILTLSLPGAVLLFAYAICGFLLQRWTFPECIADVWSWRTDSWIANYKCLLAGAQRANFSTVLSRTASTTPTPTWRCKEAFDCISSSILTLTSGYSLVRLIIHPFSFATPPALGGQGGCRSRDLLSWAEVGVLLWVSGCFVTGFQGETNSCLHSSSSCPHTLELSVNWGCTWTLGAQTVTVSNWSVIGMISTVPVPCLKRGQLLPWVARSVFLKKCFCFCHTIKVSQSSGF